MTLVALDDMACNVVLTQQNGLGKQMSKMHTHSSTMQCIQNKSNLITQSYSSGKTWQFQDAQFVQK